MHYHPVASTLIELASIELVSIMKSAQVDSTGVFLRSTTTVGVGSFGLAALGLNTLAEDLSVGDWHLGPVRATCNVPHTFLCIVVCSWCAVQPCCLCVYVWDNLTCVFPTQCNRGCVNLAEHYMTAHVRGLIVTQMTACYKSPLLFSVRNTVTAAPWTCSLLGVSLW